MGPQWVMDISAAISPIREIFEPQKLWIKCCYKAQYLHVVVLCAARNLNPNLRWLGKNAVLAIKGKLKNPTFRGCAHKKLVSKRSGRPAGAIARAGSIVTLFFRCHPVVFLRCCCFRFVGDFSRRIRWAGTVKNSCKVLENHSNRKCGAVVPFAWLKKFPPRTHKVLVDTKLNQRTKSLIKWIQPTPSCSNWQDKK